MPQVSLGEIDRIVAGQHHDPHSILGAHPGPDGITVRALRPLAASVAVVLPDGRGFPMRHVHEGVFETTLPPGETPDYRIAVAYQETTAGDGRADGETLTDDPYRHLPTVGEMDLYLIGEGRHERLWDVLGAHVRTLPAGDTQRPPFGTNGTAAAAFGPVTGTSFAVWAPSAQGVRVTADFNHWAARGGRQ